MLDKKTEEAIFNLAVSIFQKAISQAHSARIPEDLIAKAIQETADKYVSDFKKRRSDKKYLTAFAGVCRTLAEIAPVASWYKKEKS